jgi:hypothetical protein
MLVEVGISMLMNVGCVRKGRLESKLRGGDKSILEITIFRRGEHHPQQKKKLILLARFVVNLEQKSKGETCPIYLHKSQAQAAGVRLNVM